MKLRIEGDFVILDGRGKESIANCKKLFKLARLARRENKAMKWEHRSKIDNYNDIVESASSRGRKFFGWGLYGITNRGTLEIGCEHITWKQILPIARKLGFRRFD